MNTERFRHLAERIYNRLSPPLDPKLIELKQEILDGRVPEIQLGRELRGIDPFEGAGGFLRVRCFRKDGLEESFVATVGEKGNVIIESEGVYPFVG